MLYDCCSAIDDEGPRKAQKTTALGMMCLLRLDGLLEKEVEWEEGL